MSLMFALDCLRFLLTSLLASFIVPLALLSLGHKVTYF